MSESNGDFQEVVDFFNKYIIRPNSLGLQVDAWGILLQFDAAEYREMQGAGVEELPEEERAKKVEALFVEIEECLFEMDEKDHKQTKDRIYRAVNNRVVKLKLTPKSLVEQVSSLLEKEMKRRIPEVICTTSSVAFDNPFGYDLGFKSEKHQIFRLYTKDSGIVSVAARTVPYGNIGVAISWRAFERNLAVEFRQMLPVGCLLTPGLLSAVGGILVYAEIIRQGTITGIFQYRTLLDSIAYVLINPLAIICFLPLFYFGYLAYQQYQRVQEIRRQYSTATVYQQFETRLLATAVNDILLEILTEFDIEKSQLRVVRSQQEEGVADLTVPYRRQDVFL